MGDHNGMRVERRFTLSAKAFEPRAFALGMVPVAERHPPHSFSALPWFTADLAGPCSFSLRTCNQGIDSVGGAARLLTCRLGCRNVILRDHVDMYVPAPVVFPVEAQAGELLLQLDHAEALDLLGVEQFIQVPQQIINDWVPSWQNPGAECKGIRAEQAWVAGFPFEQPWLVVVVWHALPRRRPGEVNSAGCSYNFALRIVIVGFPVRNRIRTPNTGPIVVASRKGTNRWPEAPTRDG